MPKSSRSERKEDRIQILERELANAKKKNAELQKHKTIRLDDEQINAFLDELTERIEWSTNRIIDETSRATVISTTKEQSNKKSSSTINFFISLLLIPFSVAILYSLFSVWGRYWKEGYESRIALFIVAIIGVGSLILGIEIKREKDHNYIISLFSAFVALATLLVSLVG